LRETFPPEEAGRTRDKIGAFTGVSGKTVQILAVLTERGCPQANRVTLTKSCRCNNS